jgi:cytoskeletal protein CcmA (bactofilin family)
MLESRKPRIYNENKVVTILGPGTKVTGELSCKGTIRIEGLVEGTIYSDDSIVLLDTGRVQGDVCAGQVIVSGEVRGNIKALDRLEITTNGKVIGDITTPRICIQEGVLFEGLCTMKPGETPAVTPASPEVLDKSKVDTA